MRRTAIALALLSVFAATFAFAARRDKPAISPRLFDALQALAQSEQPCAGLDALFVDGSGFHGWTHVDVRDGRVRVRHNRPGGPGRTWDGTPTADECRQILQKTLDGELWRAKTYREEGQPDETQPQITIGVASKGSFFVQIWANDTKRKVNRSFVTVKALFLEIAKRVTDGAVTY